MALKFLEPVVEVRKRPGPKPMPLSVAAAERVMAMAQFVDHMHGRPSLSAAQNDQAAARQETKTKLAAFVWFVVLAGALVGFMWAGVNG